MLRLMCTLRLCVINCVSDVNTSSHKLQHNSPLTSSVTSLSMYSFISDVSLSSSLLSSSVSSLQSTKGFVFCSS